MRVLGVLLPLGSLVLLPRVGSGVLVVKKGFSGPGALSQDALTRHLVELAVEVAVIFVLVSVGIWMFRRSWKAKGQQAEVVAAPAAAPPSPAPVTAPVPVRPAARRWHFCNVLQLGPAARQLWQFNAKGGGFVLDRAQTMTEGQSLPTQWILKDWRTLWQRKLNVAWLPPENVFLRVERFPVASHEETRAMVELQLERLSPVPVTQVVWTIHVLPGTKDNQQTVIVLIVAREVVEAILGQLEEQGFLADRLELNLLDQLQATPVNENGAWVYAGPGGHPDTALVAWWYDGVMRNLSLLHLPAGGDRVAQVRQQLIQPAWAGELDGWLTAPPAWHLVADETVASEWAPILREALDEPIQILNPLAPVDLASQTARRAAQSGGQASLLPPEFATRYHQQFVDRLWMRGLLGVGALYLLGVLIYFAALELVRFQKSGVETKVAALRNEYTNTMQLKARFDVLRDRQELKYAALDCWKLVAELMPVGVTLQRLDFADGRKLTLNGTAPADQVMAVIEFSGIMRKAQVRGQPMFDRLKPDQFTQRGNPGASTVTWSFVLELNQPEVK
jgi:hypothetical protein